MNPRALTYTLGESEKNISLMGMGMGLYKVNDQKNKNYVTSLRYWYEGSTTFADTNPKATLSAFFLPYKFMHKSLDFAMWSSPDPKTMKNYQDNRDEWQSIPGMKQMVSIEVSELESQYKYNKVTNLNILAVYQISFKCPKTMPAVVFRLMVKEKGKERYVPGSISFSSHVGEKRSVNGLGYISGKFSELEVQVQVMFTGEDDDYEGLF